MATSLREYMDKELTEENFANSLAERFEGVIIDNTRGNPVFVVAVEKKTKGIRGEIKNQIKVNMSDGSKFKIEIEKV